MSDRYQQQGLLRRYAYERADGQALDVNEELFTLRIDKDDAWGRACRATLLDHADRIEKIGYVRLAAEMRERVAFIRSRLQET